MPRYTCGMCQEVNETIQSYLHHIKLHKPRTALYTPFKCPVCNSSGQYEYHRAHIRLEHWQIINDEIMPVNPNINPLIIRENALHHHDNSDNDSEEEDIIDENYEEKMHAYEEASILEEREPAQNALDELFSFCLNELQNFETKMNMTKKNITCIVSSYKSIIFGAFDVLAPFVNAYVVAALRLKTDKMFDAFSTEYKREKFMKLQNFYIPAECVVVGTRSETNVHQSIPRQIDVYNYAARVSMQKILETLFSSEKFIESLLMPSDFLNRQRISHPFSALRAIELHEVSCLNLKINFFFFRN